MNLYEKCADLFGRYPLAVDPAVNEMTLATVSATEPRYYILGLVPQGRPAPFCDLSVHGANRAGLAVQVDGTERPGDFPFTLTITQAEEILSKATPLPRDGSLFGWVQDGTVTILLAFYNDGGPDGQPSWAPLIRADVPQRDWPPFVGERLLGPWLWQHELAGRIVDVGTQLAGRLDLVHWADTTETLGCGLTSVTRDTHLACGVTLPAGLYVYHQVLADSRPLPDDLSRFALTDLGPRFTEAA